MDALADATSAAPPRRWFYTAAVVLMLIGVTTAFVQKARESIVGVTVGIRIATGFPKTDENEKQIRQIIQESERWQCLSLAVVFLAIASWVIAVERYEKCRWGWGVIVVLLALYVMLQLMAV